MSNKSLTILICVLIIATLIVGPSKVEARYLPRLPSLFNSIISVQGTIFCTANAAIGTIGTSTRVFPNATVELRCGNEVVTTVRTNSVGMFRIFLDVLQFPLTSLLTNCRIVVNTPLSVCDSTLPSAGRLISTSLQFFGNFLPTITNIIPVSVVSFNASSTLP